LGSEQEQIEGEKIEEVTHELPHRTQRRIGGILGGLPLFLEIGHCGYLQWFK
jgi:hypothetical protein